MYDSLRLDFLPSYGGETLELPNFKRLAEHTATFDSSYVCSLPCMPARRELHTGRPNFLHRGWGPLEPFDDSMPEILKRAGVYTRLVTDHYHYVEDGGATYHPRYSTWECNRGQEGDPWVGDADRSPREAVHAAIKPDPSDSISMFRGKLYMQDMSNREKWVTKEDWPQSHTFDQGVEFIENNLDQDRWFIHIESFDPHEPFSAPKDHIARLCDPDSVSEMDWPPCGQVNEPQEIIDEMRIKYLASVSFCDESLGRVLDTFDKHDLWKDTMLIVCTDHGLLLTEHGWWGKNMMPNYQEIAHTPLFIWDPRCKVQGVRRKSLAQMIDMAPTLLDFFGVDIPKDMVGRPLRDAIANDCGAREYGMFGLHGGTIGITDGRYTYFIAPKKDYMLYDYTLMPMHMSSLMRPEELREAKLHEPFSFTKGCSVLQLPTPTQGTVPDLPNGEDMLFDIVADPHQTAKIEDAAVVARMRKALVELMKECDAPVEAYGCYGLDDLK